jgi:predicted transposase/invertase (TIGR01784 family)
VYDNICKYIADQYPREIANWLIGEPLDSVELEPKELSLDPIRTDYLVLRQSKKVVLHAEFQTAPKDDLPFRMLDYRVRVYRRYPEKTMKQVIVYLKKSNSNLVDQDYLNLENTTHKFKVIRLWEQPTNQFLENPGLLPFAILTQEENKLDLLREIAQKVESIPQEKDQTNIANSAAILAGLVLKKDQIFSLLRSDIMKESVVYQAILNEGREQGKFEGKKEGKLEGIKQGIQTGIQTGIEIGKLEAIQEVAINLLKSGMSMEQVINITGLSLEQVEKLP